MSNGFILRLPNAIRDTKGNWTKEVEIDEMEGDEEDILADQERAEGGAGTYKRSGPARITEILSRCTTRIGKDVRPNGNRGPMGERLLPDYFKGAWDLGFTSDRIFTMIRLRQLSLGNVYRFSRNCPACKKEILNICVDLAGLLVIDKPLELAAQDFHAVELPRSRDIVNWRFVRGVDEEIIDATMKEHKSDFVSALLYRRIASVQKFDEASNLHLSPEKPEGGLVYLKRMKTMDRRYFAAACDDGEGGIDTNIQIICDNGSCRTEFTTKLQVMGGDFFFPSETHSLLSSTNALSPKAGDGDLASLPSSPSASADAS